MRTALSASLLAILAVCEARTLRVPELEHRCHLVLQELGGAVPPRGSGMGFFFDPAYSDFLAEVARRTPRDATIAVLVPWRPDVYRFQAAYVLAPRRVVDDERLPEARWIASWKSGRDRASGGVPVGGGLLLAR